MGVINATGGRVPYDLTNVTATDNILQFIQQVNLLTDYNFMTGMLLAGWIIMFVSMRYAGNKDALVASSFIIAVMAIFFRALEFITTARVVIIMIAFGIIFVINLWKKE